jgi:outer membrane protein OmpA-like peptidoglycan-associated protein
MRSHMKQGLRVAVVLVPMLTLACVSTAPTPSVVDARQAYQLAAQNPKVTQYASEQLYEAQQANARMERALKRGSDESEVDHLAYLTKRNTEIAQAAANERVLREQIAKLGERRDQLRLDARTAEAREARGAAATAMGIAVKQGQEIAELRERNAEAEQEVATAERQTDAAEQEVAEAQADVAAAERKAEQARQSAMEMARRLELASKESERGLVITLGDVLFKTGSATLASGAERTLSRVAELLKEYPDRAVIVEGHTDDVGSNAFNERLSQQRAQSVADALTADGVPATRLRTRGLGESAPSVPNTDMASRQQNRRVEIVLSPAVVAD